MTYAAREISVYGGQPFELYLFQTREQTWRVTSGDKVRSYLDAEYQPLAITRTSTAKGGENKSGNITVKIPRDHEIAGLFRTYMPSTPLSLVIFRGHDAESQVVVNFVGRVTVANLLDLCELTCAPEETVLRRRIPTALFQTPCNRILYSAACGVVKTDYQVDGVLTYASGAEIRAAEYASAGGGIAGWLTNGFVEFGNQRRMILSHAGNQLVLISAIPELAPGDVVSAFAGCDRTFATCVEKFANGGHFLGFEQIPRRNPFNGMLY